MAEWDVPHTTGMTWTTDAFYRETRAKVARRREEGCITVEMEASALIAVSRFRGIRLGQLLYAGDSLAGEAWDHRGWVKAHDVREQLFWLAADAAVELASADRRDGGAGGWTTARRWYRNPGVGFCVMSGAGWLRATSVIELSAVRRSRNEAPRLTRNVM